MGGELGSEKRPVQAWVGYDGGHGPRGSRVSPRLPLTCMVGFPREHVEDTPIPGRGLTDESEILRFLQHGTLVGLLPVPHPILIRKYQANSGTAMWFRTYMWGVIYLRWAPWGGPGVCLRVCPVGLMPRQLTGVVLSGGGWAPRVQGGHWGGRGLGGVTAQHLPVFSARPPRAQ